MHPSLYSVDHRPWPLPETSWRWRQSWLDLAFIHYPVAPDVLHAQLPPGVDLQQFNGSAWVGLVPFRMAGVMRRPLPSFPPFSSFPELNLRTYVEVGGRPGVWFFSLDTSCWPVVMGGRHIYNLPYHSARMAMSPWGGGTKFSSVRAKGDVHFRARYAPSGKPVIAKAGTFEHWATERYCLYAHSQKQGVSRVEVHHAPWCLQSADVRIEENSVLEAAGIKPLRDSPICHYSKGVHVISFGKEKVLSESESMCMPEQALA